MFVAFEKKSTCIVTGAVQAIFQKFIRKLSRNVVGKGGPSICSLGLLFINTEPKYSWICVFYSLLIQKNMIPMHLQGQSGSAPPPPLFSSNHLPFHFCGSWLFFLFHMFLEEPVSESLVLFHWRKYRYLIIFKNWFVFHEFWKSFVWDIMQH